MPTDTERLAQILNDYAAKLEALRPALAAWATEQLDKIATAFAPFVPPRRPSALVKFAVAQRYGLNARDVEHLETGVLEDLARVPAPRPRPKKRRRAHVRTKPKALPAPRAQTGRALGLGVCSECRETWPLIEVGKRALCRSCAGGPA